MQYCTVTPDKGGRKGRKPSATFLSQWTLAILFELLMMGRAGWRSGRRFRIRSTPLPLTKQERKGGHRRRETRHIVNEDDKDGIMMSSGPRFIKYGGLDQQRQDSARFRCLHPRSPRVPHAGLQTQKHISRWSLSSGTAIDGRIRQCCWWLG